jgi:hypothetical protein
VKSRNACQPYAPFPRWSAARTIRASDARLSSRPAFDPDRHDASWADREALMRDLTHFAQFEAGRSKLFEEVDAFLRDAN